MANRQNIAGKLSIHVSICCISHDHEAKDLDDNNDNNDNNDDSDNEDDNDNNYDQSLSTRQTYLSSHPVSKMLSPLLIAGGIS